MHTHTPGDGGRRCDVMIWWCYPTYTTHTHINNCERRSLSWGSLLYYQCVITVITFRSLYSGWELKPFITLKWVQFWYVIKSIKTEDPDSQVHIWVSIETNFCVILSLCVSSPQISIWIFSNKFYRTSLHCYMCKKVLRKVPTQVFLQLACQV